MWEPPRFMSVNTALAQLLEADKARGLGVCNPSDQCIGLARVGQDSQRIVSGTIEELLSVDFGPPLHSLVLPAPDAGVHDLERAMVARFSVSPLTPRLPPAPPPATDSESDSESHDAAR